MIVNSPIQYRINGKQIDNQVTICHPSDFVVHDPGKGPIIPLSIDKNNDMPQEVGLWNFYNGSFLPTEAFPQTSRLWS